MSKKNVFIILIVFLLMIKSSSAENYARNHALTGYSFSVSQDDSLINSGFGNLLGGKLHSTIIQGNNLSQPTPDSDLWHCNSVQPLCGVLEVAPTDISRNRYGYGDSYFYEPGDEYNYQNKTFYTTKAVATSDNGKSVNITLIHKISNVYGNCYLYNMRNGAYWNCIKNGGQKEIVNINYGISSGGIKSLDISSANVCGTGQTCGYRYASWLGRLDIELGVLVPQVLEGGTYHFNNVKVASLERGISSAGNTNPYRNNSSILTVSGSITVPDRCYISVSDGVLDFGVVTLDSKDGFIAQRALRLNAGCIGIDKNIRMETKIEPINATENNYILKLSPVDGKGDGENYIGIVPKKTMSTLDACANTSNSYMFNIFNTIDETTNITSGVPQNYTFNEHKIFFNLCHYGGGILPAYGNYSGSVKLITRFSF